MKSSKPKSAAEKKLDRLLKQSAIRSKRYRDRLKAKRAGK